MNTVWSFKRCVDVLAGELALLKKISYNQNIVRQAVMNKDWADFEEHTAAVNKLGEEFALLENERVELFSALKGKAASAQDSQDAPFSELIKNLPFDEARELSLLQRELKMETLKIRALNESILIYLNEAKTLTAAFLDAINPGRGGKLYTRKGQRVSQDLTSMVVNNQL